MITKLSKRLQLWLTEPLQSVLARVADSYAELARSLERLADAVHDAPPPPEPTRIVVWYDETQENDAAAARTRSVVQTWPVMGGEAVYPAQGLIKLRSFLLLGQGRVTRIVVGDRFLDAPALGIDGRWSDAVSLLASPGEFIKFKVEEERNGN